MSQHSRAVTILTIGFTVAVGGFALAHDILLDAAGASATRLNQAILRYVAERNPLAPIRAFQGFPEVLLEESRRTNLDHCLALAQAVVESDLRHDAVGRAGEIGLFQILPTTAAMLEPLVGRFRRPGPGRDLGDLADPIISTRFAMAYLRDIMSRKPSVRDALIEYNGGPAARHPGYFRTVMQAYAGLLERRELRCRREPLPRPPALFPTGLNA
jgi:soluble lytic murein transglycosylase-like protein